MARPRKELSDILHAFCDNVYFQPPTGKMLVYPCIVYKLERFNTRPADNMKYSVFSEYSITYMTRDPDDPVIAKLIDIPMCSLNRTSSDNNLHHSYYTLYF